MEKDLKIQYPGRIEYNAAFDLQLDLHAQRVRDEIPDTLLLLEHPHVYTLGRHAKIDNLVWDDTLRREKNVDLIRVDRGGDVTYHGPGQLVGYPIIKLTGRGLLPKRLVEWIENSIICTLAYFGIEAFVHPKYPGIWVGDAKICAIGMRIKEGVSYHGFALNVSTDLSYFEGIIPCGIKNKAVCSMSSVLGKTIDIMQVEQILARVATELLPKGNAVRNK